MNEPVASVAAFARQDVPAQGVAQAAKGNFLQSLNTALEKVSQAQAASNTDNHALVQGAPGASLEQAVVASARARIYWNATVAVRNAAVNAYRTIMNMPI